MLNNITWTQFLVVLLSLTVLYYILYFIKFQFPSLMDKLNKKSEAYEKDLWEENDISTDSDTQLENLENLVNSIKADILVKAGDTATKEQLFEALAEKVANYDGLHQPAYRYALNNFIIQHSKILCGVAIEEEELEALWNKLPR